MAIDFEGAESGTSIGQGAAQVHNFNNVLGAMATVGNQERQRAAAQQKAQEQQDRAFAEKLAEVQFGGLKRADAGRIRDSYTEIQKTHIGAKYETDQRKRGEIYDKGNLGLTALRSGVATAKQNAIEEADMMKQAYAIDDPEIMKAMVDLNDTPSDDPSYLQKKNDLQRRLAVPKKDKVDVLKISDQMYDYATGKTGTVGYKDGLTIDGKLQRTPVSGAKVSPDRFREAFEVNITIPEYADHVRKLYATSYNNLSEAQKKNKPFGEYVFERELNKAKELNEPTTDIGGGSREGNDFNLNFGGGNRGGVAVEGMPGVFANEYIRIDETVKTPNGKEIKQSKVTPVIARRPLSLSFQTNLSGGYLDASGKFHDGVDENVAVTTSEIVTLPVQRDNAGHNYRIAEARTETENPSGKPVVRNKTYNVTPKLMKFVVADKDGETVYLPLSAVPANKLSGDTQKEFNAAFAEPGLNYFDFTPASTGTQNTSPKKKWVVKDKL